MSWNEFEYSVASSQPLTLYEFIRGGKVYYRYTNADKAITIDNVVWQAIAISDSGLSQNTSNNIEITLPADNKVVDLYRRTPPSEAVRIRIYRKHLASDELKTVWVGIVSEVKRENVGIAKLITISLVNTFGREGLRLTWGRNCPHALYDKNCRVKAAQYIIDDLSITKLDGSTITINLPANIPDGYLSGGFISFVIDDITERRGIRVHKDNTLQLFGGTSNLRIGRKIKVYPGCDGTIATCNSKFSNHFNFGGCPQMPGKSPYNVSKVF